MNPDAEYFYEDGKLVAADTRHPAELLEPEPPRAIGHHAAALRYFTGQDDRTLEAISEERECSKQYLGALVCRIADRLGIPTVAPGKRRKKIAPPLVEASNGADEAKNKNDQALLPLEAASSGGTEQ